MLIKPNSVSWVASLTEVFPIYVLLIVQLLLIFTLFLYFRNKLRKNAKRLNEQILVNRKAIASQKLLFTKGESKMEEMLNSIGDIQSVTVASQQELTSIKRNNTPHLFAVLSLPKCGGSTIARTLKHSFPNQHVEHWHIYSAKMLRHFSDLIENVSNEEIRSRLRSQLRSALEIKQLLNHRNHTNVTFIAGVREPIALGISSFFQVQNTKNPSRIDYSIDEIQNAIETSKELQLPDLLAMDQWFNNDLLNATGHDVMSEPFPVDPGYKIYRGGKGDLCVYRLENFDSILDAMSDIIDCPKSLIEIESANIATEKPYAAKYREVLAQIHFSDNFIDQIYQSRYTTHFFSKKEIEAFKSRWSR